MPKNNIDDKRRKHILDNGKLHHERGYGGMPYLSYSYLDQGTFSMDVGCSVVNGRVEVKEIARNKKCAYLDYNRQQVKIFVFRKYLCS